MSEDYKKPFIPIWMDQAGLTPHQFRVLAHLWSRGQGRCFPSLDTIAECCGIKRGTVCKVLKFLEDEKELVTRRKRKTKGIRFANEYILTGPIGAPVKTKPTSNEPGRLGHHVTRPFEAPGNRAVWGTGNDTSMNDTSENDTSQAKETKETTFSTEKEASVSNERKQELLASASLAKNIYYPNENDFDDYLVNASLDHVVNGRTELYHELARQKWNHWNPNRGRWEHIKDWRKYVEALDAKMNEACGL